MGLIIQGVWIVILIMLRTVKPDGTYGNLYSNLLDYVVFAALMFYVLTIASVFVLRKKRPDAERPYGFGYPIVPLLYIVAASAILLVLLFYRTETAGWKGDCTVGIAGVWLWSREEPKSKSNGIENLL